MVSEPKSRIPASTLSFRPLIIALTVITVVIPITIPRMVSAERSGFLRRVSNARSTSSRNFRAPGFRARGRTGSAIVPGKTFSWVAIGAIPLFRPQRFDGIELSGFRRRVGSEKEPHTQRHKKSAEYGPELHGAGQRRNPGHNLGQEHAENHAERAAYRGDGGSFDQELHQDITAPRSDRFTHADLAGALGHADQHNIHDHDAADYQ